MKLVLLDAATLGEGLDFSLLDKFGEVVIYQNTTKDQVVERICDADIVLINKIKLGQDNLPFAKNLKQICIFATGFDNVDLAVARSLGIAVCNVRGYSTHSVAQLTILMALTLIEKIGEYTKCITDGEYQVSGVANKLSPIYREIYGKTWGIIGAGAIGMQVANVAKALGCKVIAYKRTKTDEIDCVDLDTLLCQSDIISIHTPLNDGTRGLIGSAEICKMKSDAILINVARGAVTNEIAIVEAIKNGKIGAFASDVYSAEPFPKEHPFNEILDMPNVLLTPHMAWGALEARIRCLDETVKNIDGFLNGTKLNRLD